MYGDKKTIKDKLPSWWRHGDPLYYCEEDDTLWTSQEEVSIHWYDIRIKNIVNLLNKARNEAAEHLAGMSRCKSMYPVYQKEIDRAKERLKVLMTSRDWRETNASHAEKKREVVHKLRQRIRVHNANYGRGETRGEEGLGRVHVQSGSDNRAVEVIGSSKRRCHECPPVGVSDEGCGQNESAPVD